MLGLRDYQVTSDAPELIFLSQPEHAERLIFETLQECETQAQHEEVASMVRDLANDHDWEILGELLEEWDQSRAHCAINARYLHTAIDAILNCFMTEGRAPGEEGRPLNQSRLPDAVAEDLETAAKARPDLYALRTLAAFMRISQAWDYRGTQRIERLSDRGRMKLERAAARAMELLRNLDAKELNAPFVAMGRFNLLPFQPDAGRRIMEEYKDWICLDPSDLAPHVKMGIFLLPRWFGSHQLIEKTAGEAVAWTQHEIGSAAYCVLYASALRQDPKATLFIDPNTLTDSVEDLITLRRRDPSFVPHVVQELFRFSKRPPMRGITPPEEVHWQGITDHLQHLALAVVRRHLTSIHPDSWRNGTDEALDYISLAAQEALQNGDDLIMNQRGITRISVPAMTRR